MKRLTRAGLAVTLVTAGALPVLGFGMNAGAADTAWTGGPVTIRVELDLPGSESAGPLVQQVENVVPGPGIELTSDDVVSNPSEWQGSVQVDIDPEAHTVTVATGQKAEDEPKDKATRSIDDLEPGMVWDDDFFETATVTITGANFESFTNVSDDLWVHYDELVKAQRSIPQMPLTTSLVDGVATAAWETEPGDSQTLGQPGVAVFAYTLAEPVTTTAPATTTPATMAPTTSVAVAATQAQAATPTAATPSYTG